MGRVDWGRVQAGTAVGVQSPKNKAVGGQLVMPAFFNETTALFQCVEQLD